MKKVNSNEGLTPSQRITNQISEVAGWRGQMLARLRELILEAVPASTWSDSLAMPWGGGLPSCCWNISEQVVFPWTRFVYPPV
jgi:hypothetical protein